MIVLDASAIVAVLSRESGCDTLIAALERAGSAVASPIAVFEAALGLRRKRTLFGRRCGARRSWSSWRSWAPTWPRLTGAAHEALEAFSRFGKGTGHRARLNLGDCFTYARARALDAPLLFIGEDFTRTDIPAAS